MKPTPIQKEIVNGLIAELGIQDFAKATIREVKQVAAKAEKASGVEFIKMEMGIPGLPAAKVGVDAQIQALKDGIAHSYPDIQGLPELTLQASSRPSLGWISLQSAACPSVEVCRERLHPSSHAHSVIHVRTPFSSSTRASPFRRCSCRSWA